MATPADEQAVYIRAILEEDRQGHPRCGQPGDHLTWQVAIQTMQALQATTEAEIETQWTKDQMKAYRKLREEERQRRGRRAF